MTIRTNEDWIPIVRQPPAFFCQQDEQRLEALVRPSNFCGDAAADLGEGVGCCGREAGDPSKGNGVEACGGASLERLGELLQVATRGEAVEDLLAVGGGLQGATAG